LRCSMTPSTPAMRFDEKWAYSVSLLPVFGVFFNEK